METIANQKTFRQYLSFLFGQQFSLLGSTIVQFVIIWWITVETGSPVFLSLAALAGFAPMVVLAPFTGVLADRWNRKIVIILADFCQAFATIVLILLFWSNWASIYVVLGMLTVRGIFQTFHAPTVSAIIPSMVPKDKLSRINGLEYVLNGIVQLGGPVIAALLLVFARIDQVLWIDPLTFAIAIAVLVFIRIPSVRGHVEKSSFKKDFKEGLSYVKGARGLLPLIFLATALNFLLMPIVTLLPYYIKFDHLGGVGDLALIEAFLQGGFFAGGAFMLLTKGFSKKIAAFVGSIIISLAGYAIISFTPIGLFWFMAIAALIHTVPVPVANISVRTILQTVVPLEIQGRVGSVVMSLASLATPVGMILSGALAKYVGTSNLFLASALIGILITVPSWFLTKIRHVENMQENMGSQDNPSQ
jgi:DHA3 family macrolide efflux protein-like MFS transporter